MRRAQFEAAPGFRFDPAAKDTSAGKADRPRATVVDHRQLQIVIERSRGNWMPHSVHHRSPTQRQRGGGDMGRRHYGHVSDELMFGNRENFVSAACRSQQ